MRAPTQREWLTEDVEQIRRYFPGATLIEVFDTPFNIAPYQKPRAQRGRERKASGSVRAGSERSDAGTRREASLSSKHTAFTVLTGVAL